MNGVTDGLAVLIAPGDVAADFGKEQPRLYELRQYPVLGAGATHFFETSKIDPSIPETVFTTNITFLLSRENKAGSKKTKIPPIPKENIWTARLKKTEENIKAAKCDN